MHINTAFTVLSLLAVAWLSVLLLITISAVEGRIFPVTSKLEIVSASPRLINDSVISFKINKLRNCEIVSINWFQGSTDNPGPQVLTQNAVKHSAVGEITVSDFVIGLPLDELLSNSHAYVLHDCYGGWLWDTSTLIYESTPASLE